MLYFYILPQENVTKIFSKPTYPNKNIKMTVKGTQTQI